MNHFAISLSKFFNSYLVHERDCSQNTITSYRDSFILLFEFFLIEEGVRTNSITFENFNLQSIRSFIHWLKEVKKNKNSTINNRLAAIKSFCKFLQLENLGFFKDAQQILSIKGPKKSQKEVSYLTLEEIKFLLDQIDRETSSGRRDLALFSLMFDSGARVQEIINLKSSSIRFNKTPTIKIFGKGRKERVVILLHPEISMIKTYMDENNLLHPQNQDEYMFRNKWNRKFTRAGVSYLLKKYVSMAQEKNSSFPKNISCHTLRHSKAMALMRQGVNLIYIRDQLGHSSIKSTEIYARADNEMKRLAIESAYFEIHPPEKPIWKDNHGLIDFLRKL